MTRQSSVLSDMSTDDIVPMDTSSPSARRPSQSKSRHASPLPSPVTSRQPRKKVPIPFTSLPADAELVSKLQRTRRDTSPAPARGSESSPVRSRPRRPSRSEPRHDSPALRRQPTLRAPDENKPQAGWQQQLQQAVATKAFRATLVSIGMWGWMVLAPPLDAPHMMTAAMCGMLTRIALW